MIYSPDDYYFWNNEDISFQKAVLVTVKTVSKWCDSYQATIKSPKTSLQIKYKSGDLPKTAADKEKFVINVLNWIWDNSKNERYFRLYLIKNIQEKQVNVFVHDDDANWGLELSEDEFRALQKIFKKNCLPEDLFSKKEHTIIAIPKYYEKWSVLRRILFGGTHAFSPKTWESMKKYGKDLS